MSCSACKINKLQRFTGNFAIATAGTSNAYQARFSPTTGNKRDIDTSYARKTTDSGRRDAVNAFDSPRLVSLSQAIAPATFPDSWTLPTYRGQHDSNQKVLWSNNLQDQQGDRSGIAMVAPTDASEISRLRQRYSRPQTSSNLKSSLGTRLGVENANRSGQVNPSEGRSSKGMADRDRTPASENNTPSLRRGRPQASHETVKKGRASTVPINISVRNDGRTKAWSPFGRQTKGSTPSEIDRSQLDERKPWQIQKNALSEKFGQTGWAPRKRLSPDTMEGIRGLHAQYPDKYTTPALADQFQVSPEAIRRILKSKWRPNDDEEEERRERWNKRGEDIWTQMAEMGVKPPKKWRRKGIGRLSELVARGQYPAPLEWRPRMHTGPAELTPALTPVLESRRYHVPLADRIL